jgi:hypothetical protein
MLDPARRLCLTTFGALLLASLFAPPAAAEETPAGADGRATMSRPTLEIAPALTYGSIRQDRVSLAPGGAPARGAQSYGGLEVAVRVRPTRRLSLGIVGAHTECDRCEGERFSRAAFEAALYPVRSRFVEAWGAAELGFAFSKLAPVQPSLCVNGDTAHCTPRYTDEQTRTRLGPEAALGLGVDFLPLPYVSIGAETRVIGVLFDAAPGIDAPSGPTPAVFAGLTLGAHLPLR